MDIQNLLSELKTERNRIDQAISAPRTCFTFFTPAGSSTQSSAGGTSSTSKPLKTSAYEPGCPETHLCGDETALGKMERQVRTQESRIASQEIHCSEADECRNEEEVIGDDEGKVGSDEG